LQAAYKVALPLLTEMFITIFNILETIFKFLNIFGFSFFSSNLIKVFCNWPGAIWLLQIKNNSSFWLF